MRIYSGYSVNAAFTSKICSCCGRNIGELLKQARNDKSYNKVTVKDGDEVEIYNQTVKLYGFDKKDRKKYLRRNERAPRTEPIRAGVLSFDEFNRLVIANLRRPPRSLQSKDTSQSRYFCVFKDCANHNQEVHADENAAINIGRRFLENTRKKS